MAEPQPLEDVLAGKEPVNEPEETEETSQEAVSEETPVVEEPTEDTPEVAATEDTEVVEEAEPTSAKKSEDREVPLTALLDERDKRKDERDQRKALQAELEALKASVEKPEEKTDFWENPEAAVEAKVNAAVQDMQNQYQTGYLALSMQHSKFNHKDFDEAKEAFAQAAQENPALADQALQHEMPGEYIYNTGKQFMALDSVGGDVSALEARIRNEVKAELMAEMKGKQSKLDSIPNSLTDESSASAPREKVETGPTPLENIFQYNK